jgi:hypothetical protein
VTPSADEVAGAAAALALELLGRGETVRVRARGASMRPWVRDGDIVLLRAGAPRVGDVVLLRQGDFGLIHRVVARGLDGRLCVAGDALPRVDGWFHAAAIAAVAVAIERDGRALPPRSGLAVAVGRALAPLRYFVAGVRGRRSVQT